MNILQEKKQRIVFMGTPDFASHILDTLVTQKYNVVGVITIPDKPAGRGLKLQESAVKKIALKHNLPLLQPEKLKNNDFIEDLQKWNADVFVVIAFRMLPKIVWDMPTKGTFNLHGSLLPQYRGAAPIHWAVINGESKTGVTTFFIDEKIDTGAIIDNASCEITKEDTVGSVYIKLMYLGADLVQNTLDSIENNTVKTKTQQEVILENNLVLKDAPKIFKKDCLVSFNRPVSTVYNHIRGLNPFPGSHAFLSGTDFKTKQIKFFSCSPVLTEDKPEHSTFYFDKENKEIRISCTDGYLVIEELQMEGKKRMKALDFSSGFNWKKEYSFNN